MYSEEVMDLFQNPKNMGELEDPDGAGKVGNPTCVVPETLIQDKNNLESIEVADRGEKILTHTGSFEEVEDTYKAEYKGKILNIKNRLGKEKLTPNHLVYAFKVPNSHYYAYTKNKKKLAEKSSWHHVQELEEGDIILYPILSTTEDKEEIKTDIEEKKFDYRSKEIPKKIPLNSGFLRLVGYYLAEGSVRDEITKATFTLSFRKNERNLIEDSSHLIENIFELSPKVKERKKGKRVTDVIVYSSKLMRFFKRNFGKGAKNKRLPVDYLFLPREKQKDLIRGIWKGDGYFNAKKPRAGYATISQELIHQLKLLLLRQGIIPSIYEEPPKTHNGVHHKKAYRINIGDVDSLTKLSEILEIEFDCTKERKLTAWIEDGYLHTPITGIDEEEYNGFVNNLEVKNTKSFVTNSLALHNCGDVMKLYIKVDESENGKKISDIKFKTFGCAAAIATSSKVTEVAKGKTIEEAMEIKNNEIAEELGGLPKIKMHCSVLAADALKEAIYDYKKKKGEEIPEKLEKAHEKNMRELEEVEEKREELGLDEEEEL